MIKKYYRLAKPGIIYGNIITTIAAFLFACQWHFTLQVTILFIATVLGLSLVIASGCVFNNILDRDIDKNMERTKNRALVRGEISIRSAQVYGLILSVLGFFILSVFVNVLSAALALFGFIMYVWVYGSAKRKTEWAALIGSIPGAVPIVVGYTAYTNQLDLSALLLFLALVTWQMPHFYAISIYRLEEYKKAGIPVFAAEKGVKTTAVHILLYMAAFYAATVALFLYANAGPWYGIVILCANIYWLWRGYVIFIKRGKPISESADDEPLTNENQRYFRWARSVFFASLIVLLAFCVALSLHFT